MKTGIKRAFRTPIVVLGCSVLLAAGGCSRSSDGTVVVNAPPSLAFAVPPYLRPERAGAGAGAGVQATVASNFPPPSATRAVRDKSRKTALRFETWKVGGIKPPFERADPEAPLNCRNETRDSGRVKIVCQ